VKSGEGEDWKARLKALGIARKRRPKSTKKDLLRKEEGKDRRKIESGRRGEELAVSLLEENSLRILARNVRYPDGEIDIVALDRGTTVFVEVKRRRNTALGAPAEAVGRRKRSRVLCAALRWLAEHPARARAVRFDVVSVCDDPPEVTWIADAFGREGPA
jgi:putative endonuclease